MKYFRHPRKRMGMVLALILMFIPLALILAITVAHSITFGAGYSLQSQQRTKAFYLAESGINIAYRMFQADNFSTETHQEDGTAVGAGDPSLLADPGGVFNLTRDSDGWYQWKWEPGDPVEESYTQSGREEMFRFKLERPTLNTFRIECQARVGRQNETQILEGETESMLDYVVFDNGDLADFTGSSDEYISGKIHANGDLYVRPYETAGLLLVFQPAVNTKISLNVSSMTSGGKVIRHKDPWGQADDGGIVEVQNVSTGASARMEGIDDGAMYSGEGNAYDSFHPDWDGSAADPNSAISRWDGAVADASLGAQKKAAALRQSFEPGGYYENRAGLKVDASTPDGSWVKEVTFYNHSEERDVTVKEIDLEQMSAAGAWPDNGLLYSEEPLRLVNGHVLQEDLTIVSPGTVYIKGDFNKQFPNQAAKDANTPLHKKAAVMTPDRIYRVTSSFDDNAGMKTIGQLILSGAEDAPLYAGDDNNVLEINGALVDGVPTTDARAWIDDPENPYFVEDDGVFGLPRKVKEIYRNGPPLPTTTVKVAFAQSESFLEDLQEVRVVGTGAIAHMKNAKMADFDNSNADKTTTPWLEQTYYIPPKQTNGPHRGKEFLYDPNLAAVGGVSGVPFAPRIGRRVRWLRR